MEISNELQRKFSNDQNNIQNEGNNKNLDLDDKSKKENNIQEEQQLETHVRLSKLDDEQAAVLFENRKKQLCENLLSQMKRSNSSNSLRSTNSPRIPLPSSVKPSPRINPLQQQQQQQQQLSDTDTCNSNSSRFHYNHSSNSNNQREMKINKLGKNSYNLTNSQYMKQQLSNKNSQCQHVSNNIPNSQISSNRRDSNERGQSNGKTESNKQINDVNMRLTQNGIKSSSSQLMYKTRGNNNNNNTSSNYSDIFNFKRASENIDSYDSPIEKYNLLLVDKAAYGSSRTLSTARFPSEKVISNKNGAYSCSSNSHNASPTMKGQIDIHRDQLSKLAATNRNDNSQKERSIKNSMIGLEEGQQEKQDILQQKVQMVQQQDNCIDIYSFNKINQRNNSNTRSQEIQQLFKDNTNKISAFMQGSTDLTVSAYRTTQQQLLQHSSTSNNCITASLSNNHNTLPVGATYSQQSYTASNRLMKQLSSTSLPSKQPQQQSSSDNQHNSSRQSKKKNERKPKSSQSYSSSSLSSSSSHHLSIDLKKLSNTSKATSPETTTRVHLKPQRISSQTLRQSYSSSQSLKQNKKGNIKKEETQKQQQEIQNSKEVIMTCTGEPAVSSYRHSGIIPQPFDLQPLEPHEDECNEGDIEVKKIEQINDLEQQQQQQKQNSAQKQDSQQQQPLKVNVAKIQRSSSSSSSYSSVQNQLSSQSSLATPEIRSKFDNKYKKPSSASNTSSPALDAVILRSDTSNNIIQPSGIAAPLAFSLQNYNSNIFTFYNTSTGFSIIPSEQPNNNTNNIQNYGYSDKYAIPTKRQPSNAQSIASSTSSQSSLQLCTPISPASGCPLPPKQPLLSQKQSHNMTSQQQLLQQQLLLQNEQKYINTTDRKAEQQQGGVSGYLKKQRDISAQMDEVRQQSQALISKQLAKKGSGSVSYQQIFSIKMGKEQQQAINEAFQKKTQLIEMSPCSKEQTNEVQGFQEKSQNNMQATNSKNNSGKRSNSTSMTSSQLLSQRKSSENISGNNSSRTATTTTATPAEIHSKSNQTLKDIPKQISDNPQQSLGTTSYSKNYATMKDKLYQSSSFNSMQLSTFGNIYQRNSDRGREENKIIQKRKQSDDQLLNRNTSNSSIKKESIFRNNTVNNSPMKEGIISNDITDAKNIINMQISSRDNSLNKTKTNKQGIKQSVQIDKKSISTTEESQPSKEELEIQKQRSSSRSNSPTKSKKIHFSNQNLSFTAVPSGDKTPLKSILVNGKNSSNEKLNRNQGDFSDFSQQTTAQANFKQLFDMRQLQQEIPDIKSKIMHSSFNNDNRTQLKNNESSNNNYILDISQKRRNNSNHCIGSQMSQIPMTNNVDARSPLLLSKRNDDIQLGFQAGVQELLHDFRPKSIGLKGKQPSFYQENIIAQKINSNESLSSEMLKLNKISSDIKSISAMFSQANMRQQQVMKTGVNLNTKKESGI